MLFMKILDRKFIAHKMNYLAQSFFACAYMFAILMAFGRLARTELLGAVGVCAIASSAFIVFALCDSQVAQPRRLLGGYCISMVIGVLCHFIAFDVSIKWLQSIAFINEHGIDIVGAIAVGLAVLIMSIFNLEHPPAAGFSLGLVLEPWNAVSLVVVVIALIILAIAQRIFRSMSMSLL